nr:hypothetical protein Iba_chr07eCG7670 [Ipomoea batatas]
MNVSGSRQKTSRIMKREENSYLAVEAIRCGTKIWMGETRAGNRSTERRRRESYVLNRGSVSRPANLGVPSSTIYPGITVDVARSESCINADGNLSSHMGSNDARAKVVWKPFDLSYRGGSTVAGLIMSLRARRRPRECLTKESHRIGDVRAPVSPPP